MTHRNVDDAVELVRRQPCSFSPTSSCRNNLQKMSGATTPGFSGPLPSHPSCFESSSFRWAPKLLREFLLSLVGFWVAARMCRTVAFGVAAPSFVPPLPGGRRATDPQSPKGGSQRACTHEGCPTPRLLGASKRWCCFGSHTLPLRTVALLTQSYPAELEVTLLQLGLATSTSRSFGGRSPRWRRTVAHRAPVRDDSGRSSRSPIVRTECWKVQFSPLSRRSLLARAGNRFL